MLIAWLACYGGICNQPPQLHFFVGLTNVSFRLGKSWLSNRERDRDFLTVETSTLKLLNIYRLSSHGLWNCRDRDYWSRSCQKSKFQSMETWVLKIVNKLLTVDTCGFWNCWNFSTVKTYFWNCQDQDSRSRTCQEKSRTCPNKSILPCLVPFRFFVGLTNVTFHFFVGLTLSKLTTQSRPAKVGQENKPEYYSSRKKVWFWI